MPRRSAASLHFPIVRTERLRPPSGLNERERALFADIVNSNPAEQFRPSDGLLLVAYCRAVLLERAAAERLACDGHVSSDNKPSAWVAIQRDATKTMTTLARVLRLSPMARKSHQERPGRPQQMSYYERMALEDSNEEADQG
jgi:phage terminase small subunit